MKKKALAAALSCTLLLSASAPALAIRAPSAGAYGPISVSGTVQRSYISTGAVSFDELSSLIEKNNLTVRMLREKLASARAMDWSETYDDLNDAIDQLEDGRDELEDAIDGLSAQKSALSKQVKAANTASQAAFAEAVKAINIGMTAEDGNIEAINEALANVSQTSAAAAILNSSLKALPTKAGLTDQLDTIEDNLDTMYDNLKEVQKQEEAYYRTLDDTERQIENIIDQTAAGARALYLTILSTQNQLTSMKDAAASTARVLEEMKLRSELGQISKLTVTQVQNGYDQLVSSIPALETAIGTMKASLQSLLGELPTGELELTDTPSVPDGAIAAINYAADLAAAKENSFSLYTAKRSVEDARRDWDDAKKDEGKNSYQAKMAEHTYEAALLTQDSAIESFELGFRQLYAALAPAQATLATAEAALAYQEQTYAVAQLKYQQGSIAKNALLDAEDSLTSAKRDVETAKLDLFTAWNSYRQSVDCGLVSSAS